MAQMTGGQAVVQALQREGVEGVFGLPGVRILGIYDGFYGQSEVQLITVRHEQTTAYMADGYARVTGKPGVGLVVPGPGIQNASAALGTAYSCSSPVLLVAGQIESYMLGQDKGALHEINDQLDIVRPVTKWCGRVLKVEEIPGAIHEAMRQMQTGRPRPTLVEVPPDVLATAADVTFPIPERYAAYRQIRAVSCGLQRCWSRQKSRSSGPVGVSLWGTRRQSCKRSRKLWELQSPRRRRARGGSLKIILWRSEWGIMAMARLPMPPRALTLSWPSARDSPGRCVDQPPPEPRNG